MILLPDGVSSNIVIYADDTTFCAKSHRTLIKMNPVYACFIGTTLEDVPYSYSHRSTIFLIGCPSCCKAVYANSFFPCAVRPSKSLHLECLHFTYDRDCFKCKVNRISCFFGPF